MVQSEWLAKIKVNYPMLHVTRDTEGNLVNGGECNIFDLFDELQKAFPASQRDIMIRAL